MRERIISNIELYELCSVVKTLFDNVSLLITIITFYAINDNVIMIEEILITAFSFPIIGKVFITALNYTIFFAFNKPQMYLLYLITITVYITKQKI